MGTPPTEGFHVLLRLRQQNGSGGRTTDFSIGMLHYTKVRDAISTAKRKAREIEETCELTFLDEGGDPDPEDAAFISHHVELYERIRGWFHE
jgi:hypothetical protein